MWSLPCRGLFVAYASWQTKRNDQNFEFCRTPVSVAAEESDRKRPSTCGRNFNQSAGPPYNLGCPSDPTARALVGHLFRSGHPIREMKAELRRALTAPPERHAVGLTCRKATAGWVGRVVRTCCLSHFVSEIALNSEGCLLAQPSTACVSS